MEPLNLTKFDSMTRNELINRITELEKQLYDLSTRKPVSWRREWNGDISDEGMYVHADNESELDNDGIWQPLYDVPVPSISADLYTDMFHPEFGSEWQSPDGQCHKAFMLGKAVSEQEIAKLKVRNKCDRCKYKRAYRKIGNKP